VRHLTARRHPILCIIPPHILRSIGENGNDTQRRLASRTLSVDNTFRALRVARLLAEPRAPHQPNVTVAIGNKQRTISNAGNTESLPGALVRGEGQPATGDPAVNEAYDGLGATYDLFWDSYRRDSIDDDGLPLDATVHFGANFVNAFWDGRRMVFGDGDPQLGFQRFTIALDIIGHELTHGVTEDEAQLIYAYQSGALNESFSDVFGSLVKQKELQQTAAQADWLIGAGLFTDMIKGVALRSMKAPGTAYDDPLLGKDPQPAHMRDYVNTLEDNGGVHINSGIPNHAFYVVATRLGGNAWERAGRIWYESLRDPQLRANSSFRRFARLTYAAAGRLYGAGSAEQQAVDQGWDAVGIKAD